MWYVADHRIERDGAEVMLSARQRLGIVTALTIGAWAVPSVIVFGLIRLL